MSCVYDGLKGTQKVIKSHSPAFYAWILTSSGLWSLQVFKRLNYNNYFSPLVNEAFIEQVYWLLVSI